MRPSRYNYFINLPNPAKLLATAILLVLAAGACAGKPAALGAGEDVDVCQGYREYAALPDPSPEDREAVLAYADAVLRVMERIRTDLDIQTSSGETEPVPEAVRQDLDVVEQRVRSFREDLGDRSDDPGTVRDAMLAFTADRTYQGADARLGDFAVSKCPD